MKQKPIKYIPVDGEKSTYDAYVNNDIVHVFRQGKQWVALIGGCMKVDKRRDGAVLGASQEFNKLIPKSKR